MPLSRCARQQPRRRQPRRRQRRARLAAVVVAALGGLLPVGPAGAEDPQPESVSAATRYRVTFVARACSAYAEVMANRVRNNAVEAAAMPGRDSGYDDGEAVDPDVEARADEGCEPLVGWHFTIGGAPQRSGALSVVGGATLGAGPTAAEVPRVEPTGRQTPGVSVPGAVTAVLSDEQVALASRRELWAQGGAPTDPLLAGAVPDLGFGVLRCGLDGRAVGNVSWIAFPAGVRHVFCYAYYVRAAPAAGTVVVRAAATRPVGYPQQFGFTGTLSYAPDNVFTLATSGEPAELTVTRSVGVHRVQAQVPAGWRVAALACEAARPGGGPVGSTATIDPAVGAADLHLAAGDVLTCTYAFEPLPEAPGLTIRVLSGDEAGPVGVTVGSTAPVPLPVVPAPVVPAPGVPAPGVPAPAPPPTGQAPTPPSAAPSVTAPPVTAPPVLAPVVPALLTATVTGDGAAVTATGADLSALPTGGYRITVVPPDPAWSVSGASCGGVPVTVSGLSIDITVDAAIPAGCALQLSRPVGGIKLRVATLGGVASAAFAVAAVSDAGAGWSAAATTTEDGVPADARGDLPETPGAGTYLVVPIAPRTTVDGTWKLRAFACDPVESTEVASVDGGALQVTLSIVAPAATCTASYQFVPSTRLRLTLRFEGEAGARSGPALLEISCLDGSTGRVVLGVDDLGEAALPESLSFVESTSCTVTQPSAGAAPDASVDVSAAVDPSPGNVALLLPVVVDVLRDVTEYTVTITDVFSTGQARAERTSVLDTFSMMPVVLVGSGLVGVGALMLLVIVAWSRRGGP
ncbi:MAG TPA: hypothetical protein VK453_19875 [Micromonosporaceae bacterium]|nr:hypothetical protein [Micromonosporaceae bacterium]